MKNNIIYVIIEEMEKSPALQEIFRRVVLHKTTRVFEQGIENDPQLSWNGGAFAPGDEVDLEAPVVRVYDHRNQIAFPIIDEEITPGSAYLLQEEIRVPAN